MINQVKEQGQVPAGAVEDLTISVAVNGKDLGDLTMNQLKALIGNAAGIAAEAQNEKIAVVSAPFYRGCLLYTSSSSGTGSAARKS